MVLRFRGGTPTDVALWSGRTGCRPGRAAGFLAPLDDVAPADMLADLKSDMAGFALTDMTYKGKLYGLPYYADTISFIYNKKILDDAGIAVPTTWEEVTAAAEKLKAGGMEHPIVYEFDQELPNFFDAFVAQAYGRGGDLFDADHKALFDNPNNAAYKQLAMAGRRLQEGPRAAGDARIEDHPVDEHRQARLHHRLQLRARRHEQRRRAAARRPVRAGADAGRDARDARLHQVLRRSPRRRRPIRRAPKRPGSSSNFMAGKPYKVAKRWAVEKGLGFGQLSLFDDPGRASTPGTSGSTRALKQQVAIAKAGTWTEWTSVWSAYFRPLLAKAMVGEASVERDHEGRRRALERAQANKIAKS